MTADPSRGFTIGVGQETSFGAGGAMRIVRLEEAPEFPDAPKQLVKQANLHHNPTITSDEPLYQETVQEGAIKLAVAPRVPAAATYMPTIMQFLQAAGWGVNKPATAADTTIATYTSDSEIILTADLGCVAGDVIMIELDNGKFFPALISKYTALSKTVLLSMALPTVASADNKVYVCYTAIPLWDELAATDTLKMEYNTRGSYDSSGGSDSDNLQFTGRGIACSGLDAITFEPGMKLPNFPFSFHCADVAFDEDDLVAGTAQDASKLNVFADVDFGFCAAGAEGGDGELAHTAKKVISVTWTPPVATVPVPAEGSTTAVVNSCQGYMADPEDTGLLEVVFLQEKDLLNECYEITDDEGANTNEVKYVHVCVPSSAMATIPALSIHVPRCRQVEASSVDFGDKFVKMTCKFQPSAARYGALTGLSEKTMSPCFLAIQAQLT